ncbi:hypothetical protein D9M73_189380 [compost metagenome]
MSSNTLRIGVIAFVVQLAAEMILSSSKMSVLFTPNTTFFISPLLGAVNTTRATPGHFKCWLRPSASRHLPVLSIKSAFEIPYSV